MAPRAARWTRTLDQDKARHARARRARLGHSPATALSPYPGYAAASELARDAQTSNTTITGGTA